MVKTRWPTIQKLDTNMSGNGMVPVFRYPVFGWSLTMYSIFQLLEFSALFGQKARPFTVNIHKPDQSGFRMAKTRWKKN
jgi:hypothetical protein